MDAFKIPKDRALVTLCLPPVAPSERYLFLSALAESHRGQETVSDLLLNPRRFVPVLDDEGRTSLVRKSAIRWVRVAEPETAEWLFFEAREAAPVVGAEVEFEDGSRLSGNLWAIAPPGEQRVSDLVNRQERWLHLETGDGLYLINLEHVRLVHASEGNHARP